MKNISIAFSVSNEYIPLFTVALKSLISNATALNNYNIFVLHSDLLESNKEIIKEECVDFSNINVVFKDVNKVTGINDSDIFYENGYVTKETYYRFYIPKIFSDLNKIIYSDVDVVFNVDIAKLYETDITGSLLAAAPNISAIYNYNKGATLPNGEKYKDYFDNILKLEDVNQYIQAGISLYNLDEMREFDFETKCLARLKEIKTPVFFDQDVINSVCQKRIKILPMKWNHVWYFWKYDFLQENVPAKLYEEYDNARKNGYIYHYAGPKPIKEKSKPLAWNFWKYAMQTPFYEQFLKEAYGENTKLFKVDDNDFIDDIIKPAFSKQISVLFSSSNSYAPYLGISIFSLLLNMDKNMNYDLIVMETSLEEEYKDKISNMVNKYSNCSIRFLNLQDNLKKYDELFYVHHCLSKETYYRLFITKIFNSYDKMIYIDADTLILDDLTQLYNSDIKDNYVAGAKDYVIQSRCKNNISINNIDHRDYFNNYLALDYNKYIQCGVLLFNLKELRKINFAEKAIKMLQYLKNPYFVDQDVMNKVCEDKIYYLGPEYNYLMFYRGLNLSNIDEEFRLQILEAKDKMKIFHMPGGKPEEFPKYEFSSLYFEYALKSPFIGDLINKTIENFFSYKKKREIDPLKQQIEFLKQQNENLLNILRFNKDKNKYYRYKLLYKLSFGKTRAKYKAKYLALKALKQSLVI